MKYTNLLTGLIIFTGVGVALAQPPQLCENWQQLYTGDDATGAHVLALWQFTEGAATKDASSNGHDLKTDGAVFRADSRFGGALESFPGYPVEDKKHAAVAANNRTLTPSNAFTLEMSIMPKQELVDYPESFLVDKKYVAHTDYQLILGTADKSGMRRLTMRLGFGEDSDHFVSDAALYDTNVWHHVAFTYDGAGTGSFYRDGAALGSTHRAGRAGVAAGSHALSIGDRVGSYYHGFPGMIAQVRLCKGVMEFRSAALACHAERDVFIRKEKAPPLSFTFVNLQREVLDGATAEFLCDGKEILRVALPQLQAGAKQPIEVPVDTSLRPGTYVMLTRITIPGATPYVSETPFSFTIVARQPARMPVVMWGLYGADQVLKELPRLKEIGFTHSLGFGADYGLIYEAKKAGMADKPERVADVKRMLNAALASDFGIIASLSPGHWAANAKAELRQIDRNGKSNADKPALCASSPGLPEFCFNVGASIAQTYSSFPAWQGALLHTEVRDSSRVCFHEHDRAAYRQSTGLDYPENPPAKSGVDYKKIEAFPADHVIPDDDPALRFLSWFWKTGDGWNQLNSELNRGLKSTGRTDMWTFHDPAVRVASVYGSGGTADVISQWTYSYPDPIRIGVATDELFAMARGAAQPQQVMKMTQIIWYRTQTAPAQKGDEVTKAQKSPWEDTDPDAAFPTIAPMHLREAFWTKLARPIRGIMYHGWSSLVLVDDNSGSYRYTHPQTQHELRRLVKTVIEPLGPTLLQLPDRASDVAYLESFASQMFARRGSYGWGHQWSGDAYQVLLWARLQPEIIYDETVVQRGLDDFKVLVMMDCDVLTAGVATKVQEFRAKGGLIVGDENLCPAIKADITISSYQRSRKAGEDRAALLQKAEELRQALSGKYQPYSDSTSADVVTRCRSYGSTDYLFAINDQREFGDYVGQHGLVMEDGLPSEVSLSLKRTRGHVYDLVAGRKLEANFADGVLHIPRKFSPCEGCVLMVTEDAISGVKIDALNTAKRGESLGCRIAVVDQAGNPFDAVIPVQVEILDPSGAEAEWSGFYGAKDGQLELSLEIAPNDRTGLWQIRVRELASGCEAIVYFRVS